MFTTDIQRRRTRHAILLAGCLSCLLLAGCRSQTPAAGSTLPEGSRTPISLGPTSTASATASPRPAGSPTPTLAPLPTVGPDDTARGPSSAPVTLLVYTDFDCDLCAQLGATLEQVVLDHAGQVRLVMRPFPLLNVHDKSAQAVAGWLAAGEQGAGWSLYSELLLDRANWRSLDLPAFRQHLVAWAADSGLDPDRFAADMMSEATIAEIEANYRQALASGIPGVPFVLLNGVPHRAGLEHTNLEAAVRLALLSEQQFEAPPELDLSGVEQAVARLHTNLGTIDLQLYPQSAPHAVASFVFLAQQGWYDGAGFYRVALGRWIETGDPTNTGLGQAGYHLPDEFDPSLTFDRPGMVAMANDGPGTNSSRFMITLAPIDGLAGSYTIFGRVIGGLDLLAGLPGRQPLDDLLEPPAGWIDAIEVEIP